MLKIYDLFFSKGELLIFHPIKNFSKFNKNFFSTLIMMIRSKIFMTFMQLVMSKVSIDMIKSSIENIKEKDKSDLVQKFYNQSNIRIFI